MKDRLPKDWERKKLGEICELVRGPFGGSLKKGIFKDSGFAVYEQQHAINNQFSDIRYFIDETKFNEMKRFELNSDDLIMSCSGTMGKIAIAPKNIQKGIINQALLKLRVKENLDTSYLKFLLESDFFQNELQKNSKGAAIKNVVSVKELKDISVFLPPIEEQKKIIKSLNKLCLKIDKAIILVKENIQKTKQLNRSFFDEVFSFNKTNEIYKLTDVCDVITDGTHHTPKYEESGVIFLSSRNVTKGVIDWKNVKYVSENLHKQLQKRVSPKLNDILLAKNGTTGVAAIVDKEVDFDIYVSLALLRPSQSKIIPKYLLHFVNSPVAKTQFNSRLKGVGVPNLHLREIRDVEIPVYSLSEQFKIVEYLDVLTEKNNKLLHHYQNKLEALQRLKNSVLESAFKGEFKKEQKAKTFNLAFYQMQLIGLSIEANKYDNIPQGEMAIAKDMYLLDRLFQVPTKMNFANHNLGPFAPEIKKGITNKTHFDKKNFPNSQATYVVTKNEEELFKTVSADLKGQVFNGISELNRKLFSKISPYKRAEAKELFATVLKCIEDTQSTDLPTIREAMKNWKIKIGQFKTKFDKFPEPNTQLVIKFIVKENWHLKVLAK